MVGALIGVAVALSFLAWKRPAPVQALQPPSPTPVRRAFPVPTPSAPSAPRASRRAAPLGELGEQLAITPEALARVRDVIDAGKSEYFALLSTPRPEGSSWAENFATPGVNRGTLLLQLFTETVPGGAEKYATAIARIQRKMWDGVGVQVSPVQLEMLRTLAPDPTEIATDRDPFADFCRARGAAPMAE